VRWTKPTIALGHGYIFWVVASWNFPSKTAQLPNGGVWEGLQLYLLSAHQVLLSNGISPMDKKIPFLTGDIHSRKKFEVKICRDQSRIKGEIRGADS
jgi:hypothetical protein